MMTLKRFAVESRKGNFFEINEDYYKYQLDKNLFLLFDGIGGVSRGDVASQTCAQEIISFYGKIASDPDATQPFFFSPQYFLETNSLVNSFIFTHNKLYRSNIVKDISQRSATQALGIAFNQSHLLTVTCGNFVLWRYREGELSKMIMNENLDFANKINIDFPVSALGLYEEINPVIREFELREGDIWFAYTDGISVKENDLTQLMGSSVQSSRLIDKCMSLSYEAGKLDNQTALLLNF